MMNQKSLPTGLYAITDDSLPFDELLRKTELILQGGARIVQYRDKSSARDQDTHADQAAKLLALCNSYQALFIINDNPQLAADIGAAGVHIGRDDVAYTRARSILGKDAIIGVSCYNDLHLAEQTVQLGANYVAFGSFFASPTKPHAVVAETELLRQARAKLSVSLVAIGGITPDNGAALITAGADAVAVISGVYQDDNPQQAAEAYSRLFEQKKS